MNQTVRFPNRKIGVICCCHVFRRERKVLFVDREGGDWQFLCGGTDHNGAKDAKWVMVRVLLEFDPSLDELGDLPPEWEAERKDLSSPWLRTKRKAMDA